MSEALLTNILLGSSAESIINVKYSYTGSIYAPSGMKIIMAFGYAGFVSNRFVGPLISTPEINLIDGNFAIAGTTGMAELQVTCNSSSCAVSSPNRPLSVLIFALLIQE